MYDNKLQACTRAAVPCTPATRTYPAPVLRGTYGSKGNRLCEAGCARAAWCFRRRSRPVRQCGRAASLASRMCPMRLRASRQPRFDGVVVFFVAAAGFPTIRQAYTAYLEPEYISRMLLGFVCAIGTPHVNVPWDVERPKSLHGRNQSPPAAGPVHPCVHLGERAPPRARLDSLPAGARFAT
eukprot:354283-Chlamydomonas_euryale.AAC.2